MNAVIGWTIAMVVFCVIEALTVGLASIWFAIGSLAALIAAAIHLPFVVQMLLFIAVSVVTVVYTRPIAAKMLSNKKQPTNADRVMKMVGVALEDIDNVGSSGLVKIDGKEWTSRSFTGEVIKKGTRVRPVLIEGVKLIVVPASADTGENNKEE